jgi:ribonuclease HI
LFDNEGRENLRHIIYVDGGYSGKGGHIAWLNDTNGKRFYEKRNCIDSYRCELEAVLHAMEDHKQIMEDNEISILIDNRTVADQLNSKSGINNDDSRNLALKIWELGGKRVIFLWIPREQNKAGKILGS